MYQMLRAAQVERLDSVLQQTQRMFSVALQAWLALPPFLQKSQMQAENWLIVLSKQLVAKVPQIQTRVWADRWIWRAELWLQTCQTQTSFQRVCRRFVEPAVERQMDWVCRPCLQIRIPFWSLALASLCLAAQIHLPVAIRKASWSQESKQV